MQTYLDCVPCFVRQTIDAMRMVTNDPALQEKVVKKILLETAELDFKESPPYMGMIIHRYVREFTGLKDPYKEEKDRFNRAALHMYAQLKETTLSSPAPFTTAVKLAIAGNIIDFGVTAQISEELVEKTVEFCLEQDLPSSAIEQLKKGITRAKKIMFLGDNAGEIVFDKLLIEQMPLDRIVYVVKASPIVNDATMEDAVATGLTKLVKVIDNGTDAQGTILKQCSPEFLDEFEKADLIIAKGQAHYETLNKATGKNIFFLLKVKCPVLARDIGCKKGEMMVKQIGGKF
ncbi:damage-control phosphatase ARMT1 family protein [Syntrophomonas erecta]